MIYAIRKSGGNVIVESQNANGKQVFFGWGDGGVGAAFYGREVPGAWGSGHELRWRWTLSPSAVREMLRCLKLQLTDPSYKDKKLERAAKELQRKLSKFAH